EMQIQARALEHALEQPTRRAHLARGRQPRRLRLLGSRLISWGVVRGLSARPTPEDPRVSHGAMTTSMVRSAPGDSVMANVARRAVTRHGLGANASRVMRLIPSRPA